MPSFTMLCEVLKAGAKLVKLCDNPTFVSEFFPSGGLSLLIRIISGLGENHLNMKVLVSKFVPRDLKARRTLDLKAQQHRTARGSNIGPQIAEEGPQGKTTEDLERQQDGTSRQHSTDKALVQCSSLEVLCYQMGPHKEIIKHKI